MGVWLVVLSVIGLALAGSVSGFNYVTDINGTFWGIQDAASPDVDTGSIRATQVAPGRRGAFSTLITGYGGIKVMVQKRRAPRFNGEMMRGFGLRFDGVDRFTSTRSVDMGGVKISRSVWINRNSNWGRWLDTFTNTTRKPLTIQVAFGGQTGVGDSNSTCTRCAPAPIVNTSSDDAVVTPADAWVTVATPLAGDELVGAPIVTVLGTPSPFRGAMTFAGNWLFDTFNNPVRHDDHHEANFQGYVNTITLPPRKSRSLLHFVVIGVQVTSATSAGVRAEVEATANSLALAPDLRRLKRAEICSIANFDVASLRASGFKYKACRRRGRRRGVVKQPRVPKAKKPVTRSRYDVVGKTIVQLRADMESGVTTSRQITRAYLDRIAVYDPGQFGFNAYEIVAPDAMAQAKAADAARAAGDKRPLLGIPIAVKNLFDTFDIATTNGSKVFEGFLPARDAFQVARLREAGAVIIGKTALEEYATFGSYSNDAWGQVWNVFNPSKSPIASSGGSAVAVAGSMASAALGSQTGDSLYGPASAASLVTLRGTDGLQSGSGVMPLFFLFDFGGAMTHTVTDLAEMLNVVAGTDPEDPATAPFDDNIPKDFDWRSVLKMDALQGKRIGFVPSAWEDPFGTTNTIDASKAALRFLEDAGATIVDMGSTVGGTDTPAFPLPDNRTGDIRQEGWMLYIDSHPELQTQGFPIFSTIDVDCSQKKVEYVRENPNDPVRCLAPPAPRLKDQLDVHRAFRVASQEALKEWMDEAGAGKAGVDAVVYPGLLSDISFNDGGGSQRAFGRRDTPSARFASPTVVFPAGFNNHGQPINLQLLGRAWDDAMLVGMAYAFEQRANAAGSGKVFPDTVPRLKFKRRHRRHH